MLPPHRYAFGCRTRALPVEASLAPFSMAVTEATEAGGSFGIDAVTLSAFLIVCTGILVWDIIRTPRKKKEEVLEEVSKMQEVMKAEQRLALAGEMLPGVETFWIWALSVYSKITRYVLRMQMRFSFIDPNVLLYCLWAAYGKWDVLSDSNLASAIAWGDESKEWKAKLAVNELWKYSAKDLEDSDDTENEEPEEILQIESLPPLESMPKEPGDPPIPSSIRRESASDIEVAQVAWQNMQKYFLAMEISKNEIDLRACSQILEAAFSVDATAVDPIFVDIPEQVEQIDRFEEKFNKFKDTPTKKYTKMEDLFEPGEFEEMIRNALNG